MIRLLRQRLRPYWRQIILVMVLLLVQAIANLYLPTLNADIINNGVVTGDTAYILKAGAVMLVVTLIFVIAAIIAVYWGSKVAMGFGRDVRGALFRRVESFSQAEVNHFGTPSLITRTTNDVQQVQMVVLMMLNVVISAPIMAIGGIIMALRLNVPLSAVIVVAIPVMAVFIGLVLRSALPLFRSMQKKIDRINQVTREMLSGVRVIRAFDRTRYEEQRFDDCQRRPHGDDAQGQPAVRADDPDAHAHPQPLDRGHHVVREHPGRRQRHAHRRPHRLPHLHRADPHGRAHGDHHVRDGAARGRLGGAHPAGAGRASPRSSIRRTPAADVPVRGLVEFQDVEFRYPGAEDPVLCGITFSARPGEVTAIVGSTGSGKTTLISLIPRFYDVTGGRVLVDGVDVRDMAQQDLWSRIGLVPQKAFLFSGTVASNLRDGDEQASDAELWRYLEIAQGREFVAEMPEKLEAPVSQGGASVSGGQRQRLAIARALAKRAQIHIFDDSFSALDFTTDARLRAALKRETADATVIIVAQRVGTIMHADRIIVLEDGSIAGMGTHDELMQTSATYREIVASQLGEGEVA